MKRTIDDYIERRTQDLHDYYYNPIGESDECICAACGKTFFYSERGGHIVENGEEIYFCSHECREFLEEDYEIEIDKNLVF